MNEKQVKLLMECVNVRRDDYHEINCALADCDARVWLMPLDNDPDQTMTEYAVAQQAYNGDWRVVDEAYALCPVHLEQAYRAWKELVGG